MKNKTSKRKAISVLKWIGRIIIAQLILINISAAFHAYRFTHYYDSDKVRNQQPSANKLLLRTWRLMVGKKLPKSLVTNYPYLPYDTIHLITKNGINLEAWYMKADSSKGTVILFHGLNSNKGSVLAVAFGFIAMGYNTMLLDLRAHGNSGGITNSLGYAESEEVKLAFDYVKAHNEKHIMLWGISLGAVIISKAIYDYDIHPDAVIMEMPFDRLQDHIRARARVLGFPDEPFGFFVTLWTGVEQGYWGFGHKTSKYVKKMNCPALVLWGTKDDYVLRTEVESVFKNIASPKKKMVVFDRAYHEILANRDEAEWRHAVTEFIRDL